MDDFKWRITVYRDGTFDHEVISTKNAQIAFVYHLDMNHLESLPSSFSKKVKFDSSVLDKTPKPYIVLKKLEPLRAALILSTRRYEKNTLPLSKTIYGWNCKSRRRRRAEPDEECIDKTFSHVGMEQNANAYHVKRGGSPACCDTQEQYPLAEGREGAVYFFLLFLEKKL